MERRAGGWFTEFSLLQSIDPCVHTKLAVQIFLLSACGRNLGPVRRRTRKINTRDQPQTFICKISEISRSMRTTQRKGISARMLKRRSTFSMMTLWKDLPGERKAKKGKIATVLLFNDIC